MHNRGMDNIIMFDMDGTITPPRRSISKEMITALITLSNYANIVIVSGSDIDYIIEQCGKEIIECGLAPYVIMMPCNGTKVCKFDGKAYKEIFSVSLFEELGNDLYKKIIKGILKSQMEIEDKYGFEVMGNIISYRKSMFNWSMIGRGSSQEMRNEFSNLKNNSYIRNEAINIFKTKNKLSEYDLGKIELVLGGQTSIDIYPKGWDKTYAIKHIKEKTLWFIGDKCNPGENDYHIYKELNEKSFKTNSPKDTENIISMIIKILSSKKE